MGSHDHSSRRSLSSSSSSELTADLCSQVPMINGQESYKHTSFDYESKDTLQSLVQSCLCGRRDGYITWQQKSITSHVENVEAHKTVLPIQNSISVVENYMKKNFQQVTKDEDGGVDGTSLVNSYDNTNVVAVSEKEMMKQKNKNKNRIKWTVDLDKKFIDSVDRLGGFKKATPSGILRLMNCEGLTLFHVKSHLQKYRVTRHKHEVHEGNGAQLDWKTRADIVEALKLQMDVQHRLHEQLESQKKLQMEIEKQAKQLHDMLQFQRQLKRN